MQKKSELENQNLKIEIRNMGIRVLSTFNSSFFILHS